jgi:hypothetical protein
MTYTIAVCTVKNCPKHVEFYSKNKFGKLVHLFGFIIRIYYDARSPERQIFRFVYTFLGRKLQKERNHVGDATPKRMTMCKCAT